MGPIATISRPAADPEALHKKGVWNPTSCAKKRGVRANQGSRHLFCAKQPADISHLDAGYSMEQFHVCAQGHRWQTDSAAANPPAADHLSEQPNHPPPCPVC